MRDRLPVVRAHALLAAVALWSACSVDGTTYGAEDGGGVAIDARAAQLTLVVSEPAVTLGEGTTRTLTVVLSERPASGAAVVNAASSSATKLGVSPTTLLFSATTWNVAHALTLSGQQDANAVDETVTVSLTSADAPRVEVPVVVVDDDGLAVRVSPTSLDVDELSSAPLAVHLTAQPTSDVVVGVASDSAVATFTPSSLTFTPNNWSVDQTVTISGAPDANAATDAATISFSSPVLPTLTVPIQVFDHDQVNILPATTAIGLTEGGSTALGVKLTRQPAGTTTVSLASADPGAATVTPASLVFTTGNWSVTQTATVAAPQDLDASNEAVALILSATGLATRTVSVTVTEDDTQVIVATPSPAAITENGTTTATVHLAYQPATDVVIDVSTLAGAVATVAPAQLTFSPTNYLGGQVLTVTAPDDADAQPGATTLHLASVAADLVTDVPIAVTDDDQLTIETTVTEVTLAEHGSATFGVHLGAQPLSTVTVNVVSSDIGAATAAPAPLTFSPTSWSTAQTVTVTGAQDNDLADESPIITLSAVGLPATTVATTVTDDDTQQIVISATAVTVTEGATGSVGVSLQYQPASSVTVDVASTDPAVATAAPTPLTFTPTNYSTPQLVTIGGVSDANAVDGTTTLSLSSAGLTTRTVAVTITDDDVLGIETSVTSVTAAEGGAATFGVRLTAQPSASTSVVVGSTSPAIATAAPTGLTFTTADWNVFQTVTVTGVQDLNATNETTTVELSSAGMAGKLETVNVTDDDTQRVVVTATTVGVTEGATATVGVSLAFMPTADVVVAVASANPAVATASPGALTFTAANYATAQTVTISGTQDANATPNATALTMSAAGATSASVAVNVTDDDYPVVVSLATAGASGCVAITYAVRQPQALRVNVVVEFNDGSGFRRATQAGSSGNDGTTGITSSSATAGQAHSFLWNSTADLPHRSLTSMSVRVTPQIAGINGTPRTAGVAITNGLTFSAHTEIATAVTPHALATADLDGDGDLDVVTANETGTVSVLLGNAAGGFAAPTNVTAGATPYAIAIGDFNGDRKPDLAVALEGFGSVAILLGTGTGTFGAATKFSAGSVPYDVVSADFNRDGKLDLAVANQNDNNVSILLGKGDGTFQPAVNFAVGLDPRSVLAADFNGDGKLDLITAHRDTGTIALNLGNGDGTFQAPTTVTSAGTDMMMAAAGDFNGDGKLDLAELRDSGSVRIQIGNGDATFKAAVEFLAAGTTPLGLTLGDVDGDGRLDVITSDKAGNRALVFRGNGNGTFQAALTVATGTAPVGVIAGDFNRDGQLDLATANYDGNNVSIVLGTQVGSCEAGFVGAIPSLVGTQPTSVATGDFNGDGKPDVAVTNPGPGTVTVALGNGNGSFRAPSAYAAGADPIQVIAVDINSDGNLDLAVLNFDSSDVSVLLGNGDGTFQAAVSNPLGVTGLVEIAAGDFNGDGRPDLAVTNQNTARVYVLLGNAIGDGTLSAPTSFAVASAVRLAVGDFDGNGTLDLAITSSGTISVVLGLGDGSFTAPTEFAARTGARNVTVADVDGDGKLDLVVGGSTPGVSVLRGNGDGTFQAPLSIATPWRPSHVVTGDFDGDGAIDLAIENDAQNGRSDVSVVLGVGDGTFTPAVSYGTASEPSGIAVDDLNGDGRLDLLTSGYYNIGALLGNGNGTFQGVVSVAAGSAPGPIVAGDFNGDGRQDILTGAQGIAGVSVNLGNGDGTLQAAVSSPLANVPAAIVTGDFNRDGKLDVAATSVQGANVSVLLGNGDGTFAAGASFPVASFPGGFLVGDFNRDGKLDLVTGHTSVINLLIGNGNGTFQAAVSFALGASSGLVAGDFNGDGKLDIVTATAAATGTDINFAAGNGSGSFAVAVKSTVGIAIGLTQSADLNRDGRLDLVCGEADGLCFVPGNGNGTFGAVASLGFGLGLRAMLLGDFNNDGRIDIALATNVTVGIANGNGNGTFQLPVNSLVGPRPDGIAAGNFSNDGRLDLAYVVQSKSLAGILVSR